MLPVRRAPGICVALDETSARAFLSRSLSSAVRASASRCAMSACLEPNQIRDKVQKLIWQSGGRHRNLPALLSGISGPLGLLLAPQSLPLLGLKPVRLPLTSQLLLILFLFRQRVSAGLLRRALPLLSASFCFGLGGDLGLDLSLGPCLRLSLQS